MKTKTLKDIQYLTYGFNKNKFLDSWVKRDDLRQAARDWIIKLEKEIYEWDCLIEKYKKIDEEDNYNEEKKAKDNPNHRPFYRPLQAIPSYEGEKRENKAKIEMLCEFFNLEGD